MLLGLDRNTLKPTELIIIKKFEKDPEYLGFLPVSDILKSYGYHHQSLEILIQGVEDHPYFTAARVHLVKELFDQGLFRHSWQIFEQSPCILDQNPTALILKWKLSILLRFEKLAFDISYDLQSKKNFDKDIKEKCELIVSGFFSQVESSLKESLLEQRIPLDDLKEIKRSINQPTYDKKWSGFQSCHLKKAFERSKTGSIKESMEFSNDDDLSDDLLKIIGMPIFNKKENNIKKKYYNLLLRTLEM
ncbi:MAG: hypothetical protein AB8C84_05010 [Oligoflexales bacterium]